MPELAPDDPDAASCGHRPPEHSQRVFIERRGAVRDADGPETNPNAAGTWSAPDLAKARRLIAASGSRGARVLMWSPPRYAAVIRYAGAVLRRLGYRVRIRVMRDVNRYFEYVQDTRHDAQAGLYTWSGDFLNASSSFEPFTCGDLARNPRTTADPSRFCERAVDAAYAAAQAARGTDANARWAALDRRVLTDAPTVPLFNRRDMLLVSDRVGNAQMHPLLGPLLDQLWVR